MYETDQVARCVGMDRFVDLSLIILVYWMPLTTRREQ